jgi:flavin-dependent dehydrogenase
LLADEAGKTGAAMHYGCTLTGIHFGETSVHLTYDDAAGKPAELRTSFCLDASGFGKSLARLLGLEMPGRGPARESIFTHVRHRLADGDFDRNKILITVHPSHHFVWFWLIPFSDGTASLGVVGPQEFFAERKGDNLTVLQTIVAEAGQLGELLQGADYPVAVRRVTGYASQVTKLHGPNFALLGNAGGFIDPVFSSGVTIALKSASMAAGLLDRQLRGQRLDWQRDYADPLGLGVETFRQFVSAWYDTRLQDIIFSRAQNPRIRSMICSILAG